MATCRWENCNIEAVYAVTEGIQPALVHRLYDALLYSFFCVLSYDVHSSVRRVVFIKRKASCGGLSGLGLRKACAACSCIVAVYR